MIEASFAGKVGSITEKPGSNDGWCLAYVLITTAGCVCSIPVALTNEQARTVAPGDEFLVTIEQVERE